MLLILALLTNSLQNVVQSPDITVPVHRFFYVTPLKGIVVALIGPNQKTLDVSRHDLQLGLAT